MSQNKSPLQEVAQDSSALKTARAEPIQQTEQPRQTMDFIRSLVLDIPVQTRHEPPVSESMNIEQMLNAQLEAEVKKQQRSSDPTDTVTVDIPLLIRLLEYAREDAKTDMDLHNVTENIIKLSGTGNTLTMANYDTIVKKQELNESRYSQFKKQTEIVKPSTQMHVAIKEIKKRLQEVNKIASYTKQLKTELSETNNVSYNKRTEAYLGQLMKETATLYQNLKQIKENGKGKDKNIVS
jgi:hypothetical protein